MASAMDIATCGVTVPAGETGTLLADLACVPGDLHAVALENRTVLADEGHPRRGSEVVSDLGPKARQPCEG